MRYYTLTIPPPTRAIDSKTPFVLGVERLRTRETLRDDRILYYVSPNELSFYDYHRWISDPSTLMSELLARRLEETGTFAQVRLNPTREAIDYLLRGRLTAFEEVDHEGGSSGRVGLNLSLVRTRDQKIVWSDRRRVERPAEGDGVAGVVNALNASADQILAEALPALTAAVERENQQSSQKPH
jgi:ABC-type uncharacterized transport system auxiliary subunit